MFQRQTRFGSVENYNPSPQLYDPYKPFTKIPRTIKTGTLKGPSESNKTLGSFGGVRRWVQNKIQNPGPGSYITIKQKQSKQRVNIRKRNKSEINLHIKKYNDKYKQQFYIGNPKQQLLDSQKLENQQQIKPGYSFPKSRYKQRQAFEQIVQQQQVEVFQPEFDESSYQQLIKIKQQNRKRKFDLLEMMLKKQLPKPNALSIQQKKRHEQKPLPGPGAYNINKKLQQFQQSSSFKSKIQKIAFHKRDHLSQLVGPGTYRTSQLTKSPSYCFNRQERKTSLIQHKNLPCQFYNKQIQPKKSFNKPNPNYQAPFGSGTNRFITSTPQPVIQQRIFKIKSRSRSSTRYSNDQSQQNQIKPLQTIQVLTDFYRNK